MKQCNKACSLTAAILTLGSLVEGANAALSLQSNVFTGYGKDASRSHTIDSASTTGLNVVSVSTNDNFEHSTDPGNFLGFAAVASSSSAPQRLRTHARGTVTNNFHDQDYDFDLNDGTPSYYVSWAEAQYSETLQYGGTATNYNSRYIMRFTGNIKGVEALYLGRDYTWKRAKTTMVFRYTRVLQPDNYFRCVCAWSRSAGDHR